MSAEQLADILAKANIDPKDFNLGYDARTTAPTLKAIPRRRMEGVVHNLLGVRVRLHADGLVQLTYKDYHSIGGDVRLAFAKIRRQFPKVTLYHPDVSGDIIAVRCWSLMGDVLCSINSPWSTAMIDQQQHRIFTGPLMQTDARPAKDNSNGLYCVKFSHIHQLLRDYRPTIMGFVEVLGTAIEHSNGYRASTLMIRRLIVLTPLISDGVMKLLGDRYQCEVVRFRKEDLLDGQAD